MPGLRLKIFAFLLLLLPLNVMSQTDTTAALSQTNTGTSTVEKDNHALYAGAGYGSNMIYLGSTISRVTWRL